MHVLRHQKGTDLISKGNQLSDRDLKQAAWETMQELVTHLDLSLPDKLEYSEEDLKYLQKWLNYIIKETGLRLKEEI